MPGIEDSQVLENVSVNAMSESEEKEERVPTAEKREFLKNWALANHRGTVEQARDAVKTRFGESLGTNTLTAIMKWARGEQDKRLSSISTGTSSKPWIPTSSQDVQPGQASMKMLQSMMRILGIRKIELKDDGHAEVQFL